MGEEDEAERDKIAEAQARAAEIADLLQGGPEDMRPRYEAAGADLEDPLTQAEREKQLALRYQKRLALRLTYHRELVQLTPKPWLIKSVMARGETSSWIAPPGKGKSALLTDIATHLGGGKNWRGHRTKGRSGAVYFAFERADLVNRRLIAHRRRDDLPDLPIAVASEVIDLMNRSCVDVILATIWEAEQHFDCQVGLAILTAAGGGDEDKARDQNIVLANLRRVLDYADIHIAGIGHPGKDETKMSAAQTPAWPTSTCSSRSPATS